MGRPEIAREKWEVANGRGNQGVGHLEWTRDNEAPNGVQAEGVGGWSGEGKSSLKVSKRLDSTGRLCSRGTNWFGQPQLNERGTE